MKEMTVAKQTFILRKAPLIMIAALQGGRPLHRENMDQLVLDSIRAAKVLADELENKLDIVFGDIDDEDDDDDDDLEAGKL